MGNLKMLNLAGIFLLLLAYAMPSWASDYSHYSMDDLATMRGSMKNAPEQEQKKFNEEWQKRINEMPSEERARYTKGQKKYNSGNVGSGGVRPGLKMRFRNAATATPARLCRQ